MYMSNNDDIPIAREVPLDELEADNLDNIPIDVFGDLNNPSFISIIHLSRPYKQYHWYGGQYY